MKTVMPKIFIVEDDNFYAAMIQSHLDELGHRKSVIFNSGNEAIDKLYEQPDIVLLDYDLGDMKGIEVLKKIKSVNPNIQVVFLSGQEDLEIAVTSLKYGAFDYLEKNAEAFDRLTRILERITHHQNLIEEKDKFKTIRNIFIGTLALASILFIVYKDQLFQ